MTEAQIAAYEAGGAELRRAVAGLTPAELTARPGPGDWSIHEVVIHMADSDAIGIDRMRRVLTSYEPPILNYDETAYIATLHPHEQSVEDALAYFEIGRRQWAKVLRRLPADSWARAGVHDVRGRLTLAQIFTIYTEHLYSHLKFVTAKRERLGRPSVA